MEFAQRMVLALALLLVLGVVLVIGNTIRLAIESRRDEIVVVKLVGGTNAFVRRPFLYTGIWYGLGGGVIAALALTLGIAWLQGPISALSELYQGNFELRGLDWNASMIMILGAAFIGLLGAWLALGRHLGQIEPK
jgi:cell division transport system permease protein